MNVLEKYNTRQLFIHPVRKANLTFFNLDFSSRFCLCARFMFTDVCRKFSLLARKIASIQKLCSFLRNALFVLSKLEYLILNEKPMCASTRTFKYWFQFYTKRTNHCIFVNLYALFANMINWNWNTVIWDQTVKFFYDDKQNKVGFWDFTKSDCGYYDNQQWRQGKQKHFHVAGEFKRVRKVPTTQNNGQNGNVNVNWPKTK